MWLQLERVSSCGTIMFNKLTCQSITSLFLVEKFQRPALSHPFKEMWLGPVPSLAMTSNTVPHFEKMVVRVVNVKNLKFLIRHSYHLGGNAFSQDRLDCLVGPRVLRWPRGKNA